MRGTTHISEVSVLEQHDAIVARMPRTVALGDARFDLRGPARPHRLVGRLEATRLDGEWRAGRRRGPWRVDVVPAGRHGALLSVVLEGWRGRDGDDLALVLARQLRDRMEAPLIGRPTVASGGEVRTATVWDTART